ncbi:MAG TPA: histidine kinase [Bryobacteraceae bacterium]
MPDYLLIAELLGFGTGSVLSVLLVLLVRRTQRRAPGASLLAICALLWNVFGFLMNLLIVFGMHGSWTVAVARATYLSGGVLFPVSFLQLWSPTAEHAWQRNVNRWLLRVGYLNASWLIPLLFVCPFTGDIRLQRIGAHAVAWNASLLMTAGAVTLVPGRLGSAADRIYLVLTMVGAWGSTVAIYVQEQFRVPARLEPALTITREQSAFLAVLGTMFFFARFRSTDVLIKTSLRVVAAVSIGLWACVFISGTLLGVSLDAAHLALAAGLAALLLMLYRGLDRFISQTVDCVILRQPDFRAAQQRLWDEMGRVDSDADVFAAAERIVSQALDLSAARVLARAEAPAVEAHAAANAGGLWELSCDDGCRCLLSGADVDVLAPVRVHGEITHVLAVAPGRGRRSLVSGELKFLQDVAGQIGSRLEALAHEREMVERQSREATLRQLAAQAELKALRAQINPHFLFNSLNTIADLIVTNPVKAEAMTVLLAKVFRHVLTQSDQQLTRVAEEMEFLRTYLGIEQVRFGARLRVSMDVDPAVSEATIPSLILQPVVENAIKHGLAPKVGNGHLSISAQPHGEFVRLAVEDDGVGSAAPSPAASPSGGGLGLKIIAERLRTLYQDRASLHIEAAEDSGRRVTILIPRSEAAVG